MSTPWRSFGKLRDSIQYPSSISLPRSNNHELQVQRYNESITPPPESNREVVDDEFLDLRVASLIFCLLSIFDLFISNLKGDVVGWFVGLCVIQILSQVGRVTYSFNWFRTRGMSTYMIRGIPMVSIPQAVGPNEKRATKLAIFALALLPCFCFLILSAIGFVCMTFGGLAHKRHIPLLLQLLALYVIEVALLMEYWKQFKVSRVHLYDIIGEEC